MLSPEVFHSSHVTEKSLSVTVGEQSQRKRVMKYTQNSFLVTSILIISCLLLSVQAFAGRKNSPSGINVEVISDHRGNLRKYHARTPGNSGNRSYIVAQDNERYTIRIRNNSSERVGLVIAVDGRNILSGEKSYLRPNEKMYVLQPYASADYAGWRTARNEVNRFFFTDMDNSYSAAWGDFSAMGIIAVAAFPEHHQQEQYYTDRKHKGKMSGKVDKRGKSAGTGFGEERWSPSRAVEFVAQQHPMMQEFIKYEYRSSLCRRGIVQCQPERNRNTEFAPTLDDIWKRFSPFRRHH